MDDLMTDGYFQTVVGNATVVKTAKWDTKSRKPKKPDIASLPSDNSEQ